MKHLRTSVRKAIQQIKPGTPAFVIQEHNTHKLFCHTQKDGYVTLATGPLKHLYALAEAAAKSSEGVVIACNGMPSLNCSGVPEDREDVLGLAEKLDEKYASGIALL